jgi:hypothetical protein
VIDVSNRPDVYVRLAAVKFLFRHLYMSSNVVKTENFFVLTVKRRRVFGGRHRTAITRTKLLTALYARSGADTPGP